MTWSMCQCSLLSIGLAYGFHGHGTKLLEQITTRSFQGGEVSKTMWVQISELVCLLGNNLSLLNVRWGCMQCLKFLFIQLQEFSSPSAPSPSPSRGAFISETGNWSGYFQPVSVALIKQIIIASLTNLKILTLGHRYFLPLPLRGSHGPKGVKDVVKQAQRAAT